MNTIKIIIERNKDGFWGYAKNVKGIYGGGDTAQACKQDILDCIETIEMFEENEIPAILKGDYSIVYEYDTESFLNYYKGIFSNVAFEKITGINQKQMYHYSIGLRKPRLEKRKKIQEAMHKLAHELLAIEL